MGADSAFIQPYLATKDRIVALVRAHPHRQDEPVPACPAWTVHHVVAHLAGLAEDWRDGRLGGYATHEWTAGHVERFAGGDLDSVVAAWEAAASAFPTLDVVEGMGDPAMYAFGDAVVHEADLREVLEPDTSVPPDAVALSIKTGISMWRPVVAAAGSPTVQVRMAGLRDYWLGRPEDPDALVLEAAPDDVFRLLYGRRSRRQVEALSWSADPSPVLDAGLPFPFSWAEHDLDPGGTS